MICLIPDCLVIIYNNYRPVRIMRRNEETRQYTNNSTNDNTNDNTENVLLQAYIYIYIITYIRISQYSKLTIMNQCNIFLDATLFQHDPMEIQLYIAKS